MFEQGDVPNFQLVVVSGSVHLFGQSSEKREVLIEAVEAPDLIIPAAVMTGSPYLMQARVPKPRGFYSFMPGHSALLSQATPISRER